MMLRMVTPTTVVFGGMAAGAALAALVANGSDADVLAALRALHDRFEVVNRGCKAG